MKAFDWAVAETIDGAVAASADGWKLKAGGIDLLDRLKERTETADRLVSMRELDDLRGIRFEAGALNIGALTTLADLGRDPLVAQHLPALGEAARAAATPQIREVATVGGNLCQRPRCWYFRHKEFDCAKNGGSGCPAIDGENRYLSLFGGGPCRMVAPSNLGPILVAVEAIFEVRSKEGLREIPAGEFFLTPTQDMTREVALGPGDVLTRVVVPKLPERAGYAEIRHKESFDWPLASAAAAFRDERWIVVLGAVAPTPLRAPKAEEALGQHGNATPKAALGAGRLATEGAEPMSQNAWRLQLVEAAVRRAVLKAAGLEID